MEGISSTSDYRRGTALVEAQTRAHSLRAERSLELAELWRRLSSGQFVSVESGANEESCSLKIKLLRSTRHGTSFARSAIILQRVLLGESQKSVAADLRMATSTIAMHCSRCLAVMGIEKLTSRAPLVLVMAAHASAGFALPLARLEPDIDGVHWWVRVRLADSDARLRLTGVERDVLCLVARGMDHSAMARARGTSPRTIANQLGSVFRKFGVSGRAELLAKISRNLANAAPDARSRELHLTRIFPLRDQHDLMSLPFRQPTAAR